MDLLLPFVNTHTHSEKRRRGRQRQRQSDRILYNAVVHLLIDIFFIIGISLLSNIHL